MNWRLISYVVAATLLSVAPAWALRVDPAFGNTIRSTYPDGRQGVLWLAADGSYAAQGRRGQATSGTWRLNRERLCLRQRRPFPASFTYCTPIPDNMGAAWSARAPTGEAIRVELVHGRVTGRTGQPSH